MFHENTRKLFNAQAATLIERSDDTFAFGEWVACFDTLENAIKGFEKLHEIGAVPDLLQPEVEEEDGVYDGGFTTIGGIPFYVGRSDYNGRGQARRRVVSHYDKIQLV